MRRAALLISAAFLVLAADAVAQDTLRLRVADAIARAARAHPGLIAVRAERAVRSAQADGSRAAYLPQIALDWGVVRSSDPVAVFGSKLRQGIFAGPDLALDALNRPAPVTNTSVGIMVEQPVAVPQAWLGRRAALAGAEAGRLFETRAEQMTAFDAVRAYFGAQLAAERVDVLDSVLVAARATLERVRSFRREGVVTAVDEQLALARVSELEAGHALALAERLAAADQLLVVIGETPGQPIALTERLSMPDASTARTGEQRSDLAGLEAVVRAQDANVDRVRAQWLPSVGAFGSLNWNQGNLGAFAGPRRWTAGLMLRWSVFRGSADLAQLAQARAERTAAVERLAAARLQAEAEGRAAAARLEAAVTGLAAADRALEHARQAVRVAEARYAGGVATISELLAVRAAEDAQRLGRLDALYQARLARAALTLARGGTPE